PESLASGLEATPCYSPPVPEEQSLLAPRDELVGGDRRASCHRVCVRGPTCRIYLEAGADSHHAWEMTRIGRQQERLRVRRRLSSATSGSAVLGQDRQLHWRCHYALSPACRLISSPSDSEARMSIKRSKSWIGDRGYPTKTRDDVAPHGIVPVETTTRDSEVTGVMERNDLLSSEYFPATGQGDADRSVNARE